MLRNNQLFFRVAPQVIISIATFEQSFDKCST